MRKTCPVCPTGTVAGLLEGMAQTGFQGRRLGESVNVWKRMLADPDSTIFFELSGTMIPAGMQRCFVEMVLYYTITLFQSRTEILYYIS